MFLAEACKSMNPITALNNEQVLGLMHAAWCRWRTIRDIIYKILGVSNTEELIRWIVDTERCCPRIDRLEQFLKVLKNAIARHENHLGDIEKAKSLGVKIVPFFSREYPCELLRYKTDTDFIYPPLVLYVRNLCIDLNSKPMIAVVGTRECTEWGRNIAYELGKALAKHGWIVVTGLAEGIDSAVALGALETGGYVVGVRPWLEPLTLPDEARKLLKRFPERTVIVSENLFKPYIRSKQSIDYLYYLRNRIIAGMSKAVVVVEARYRPHSGSMHQIELALKRKKPVIIFEHPIKDSIYWRAFEKYVAKGAYIAKDVDNAIEILKKIINA